MARRRAVGTGAPPAGAKPKKAKKAPVEWERMALVEKEVDELVKQAHQHLERATIIVIGRPGRSGASRCDGIVKLSTPTSAEKVIAKDDIGDIAYKLEVKKEPFDKLTPEQKKRRLDHALCHAAGLDERGRWITVDAGHDIEEFAQILQRHGAPDDNPAFAATAAQMSLFAKKGGA